jgi:SnoaL-like domain
MSASYEAIRNLLGRYCELMDAGDFAGLADLLADATLTDESGGTISAGREDFLAYWTSGVRRYDGSPRTCHLTIDSIIEVDETAGTAVGRSKYLVLQATDGLPLQPVITGRYRDRFVRDPAPGTWRFAERQFFVDLVGDLSQHLAGDIRPEP